MVFFHCFFSKFGFLIIGIVIGILLSNPDILFPNDYQIILDYDTPKVLTYRWPVHSKNLVNSRGYKLETYRWLATNPKGLLFFFNGFGDYCDHYANMVALAVEEGFSCFCMDIEGVGRSEGLRNYIDSFNQTVRDDQIEFVKKVQTEFRSQNLPSFALG